MLETLDVSDYGAIAGVIEACAARLGGLDIVVVNAGVAINKPVGKGHFEQVRQTIDVNLTAAIATCEAAVELFRKQGHGQVVGITSVAGVRGMRGNGVYCATACPSRYEISSYISSNASNSARLSARPSGVRYSAA